ncbi:MAG: type II secretion system protein GspD [Desulfobacteraceae bacterium IS3]|nr:MAG: type II secretion system protein GspD [Desulfobacteraceae bacterium IS3]
MKRYGYFSKFILRLSIFLIISGLCHAQTPERNDSEQMVSIDFSDVDIGVFIKFMSELMGENFIVDNRVKGKVTVISPSKISVKEAYKVFESVLEVNGFATVKSGDVTKIVAAPDARTKNIETLLRQDARSVDDKVVTQILPLQYADPREIKRLLAPLVSKNSVIIEYVPTNTLIITDVYSNIERLTRILKVIDVPGVGQEISVISLEFGDAVKLAGVLTNIFQQKRTAQKAPAPGEAVRIVADERTNSVVLLASEDDTARVRELIRRLDKEIPRGTEKIRVYYLEHATAEEMAKVLQSLSSKPKPAAVKGKKEAPVVSEQTNITADKATNSLIIMAEKDDYLVLEDVIKKLDIPRSMVYIECLIMEVNVDKGFDLGAEWIAMGEATRNGKNGAYGGGFSGGDSGYSNIGTVTGGKFPPGFSMGIFSEPLQIGNIIFPNLAAIVNAYKKDKDVHILSTPQIMTTDNEEATITVGKNVPYQTKQGTTSTTTETYNTYEYKDVAITLKITPQISKDRLIRLKISQEVSKLDLSATTANERPTTLKRAIDTTVIVSDKNTIAIGGLIDDSFSRTEYKVPCLGDIPGLRWFFKSLTKGREKTNLFVFLTPHVIESPAEAKEVFLKKKEQIDTVEEDEEGEGFLRQIDKNAPPETDSPAGDAEKESIKMYKQTIDNMPEPMEFEN